MFCIQIYIPARLNESFAVFSPGYLYFFLSPFPSLSHQGSGKKAFILCEHNCVELKGNLPLATTLRSHVGTSIDIYLLIETWERTGWMGVVFLSTGGHYDYS